MREFDFYEQFKIGELLSSGPTVSHRAVEVGGRPVMAHFLQGTPDENAGILVKVRALGPLASRLVIRNCEVSGVQVIVTAPVEPFDTLERWLDERLQAEGGPVPPVAAPNTPASSTTDGAPGAFTALFGTDTAPEPDAAAPPTASPPLPNVPTVSPDPGPADDIASPPPTPTPSEAKPSGPGQFTGLFGTGVQPAPTPEETPAPDPADILPAEPAIDEPLPPGSFRLPENLSPGAAPPGGPPSQATPPGRPLPQDPGRPLPQDPSRSPPQDPGGAEAGEFTRLFGAQVDPPPPSPPSPPEHSPPDLGSDVARPLGAGADDYLDRLGPTTVEPADSPLAPPPISPEARVWAAPAQSGPSEFTQIVSGDRLSAAAPSPIRPEAPSAPETLKKQPSRRPYVFALIAIVLVAVTLVIVVALVGGREPAEQTPDNEPPVEAPAETTS